MSILRALCLIAAAALIQGCAAVGYECPACCPRPSLAEAQTMAPAPSSDPCVGVIRLRGVNFAFDRAELLAASRPVLDQAAQRLIQCRNEQLQVEGHTDSVGSDAYNQDLSERRARTVRDYLISRGVDARRISAVGFGESRPVAPNDTPENRAINRRVEVRFLD